ncbi:hypothetical protein RR48_09864 [Papilio machaon]|uniref:Reelin domain-containing protein n=1 Tax=Papilio machaon TaxID=76193 RepID=A0A194R2K3_PAPMA|nr:hypothetical protein RR48_09864 [Papilio machaon]
METRGKASLCPNLKNNTTNDSGQRKPGLRPSLNLILVDQRTSIKIFKLLGCSWWSSAFLRRCVPDGAIVGRVQRATSLQPFMYRLFPNLCIEQRLILNRNKMTLFTYIAVAVAVLAYADGYSVGAPESACKDMIPRHPVPAQKTAAPYKITTSTKVVRAGTPMEVTISGNKPSDTMRGILLQARKGDDIVGTFTLDPNDSFAQLLNCGAPGNALIKFRATIAYNGAVFWVGVESAPVTITH